MTVRARLSALDRHAGERLREAAQAAPAAARALAAAAAGLSPAFRLAVALMAARRTTRRTGLAALAAGVAAALLARVARDRIGRPRPGPRTEGGFPSRHAAASVAIAVTIAPDRPGLARAMGATAAVGLAGRVTGGHHEPGDVLAGAAAGWAVGRAVRGLAGLSRDPAQRLRFRWCRR